MRGIFIRKPGESPASWLGRLRAVDTLPLNEAERVLLHRAVQQAEQDWRQEREDAAAPFQPDKEPPVGRRKGKGTPKGKGKSKED